MPKRESRGYTGSYQRREIDLATLRWALGPEGPFAQGPGYQYRQDQIDLAVEIATTINNKGSLIANAPTGLGKTLAICVPLILAEGRGFVATSGIGLQHQVEDTFVRAISTLNSPLPRPLVVKGRDHYLCPVRVDEFVDGDARNIRRYLHNGISPHGVLLGDVDRVAGTLGAIPPAARPYVERIVPKESCFGHTCPQWEKCPRYHLTSSLSRTPLVVLNHALLAQWARIELLQGDLADTSLAYHPLIIDEAHGVITTLTAALTPRLNLTATKDLLDTLDQHWGIDVAVAVRCLRDLEDAIENQLPSDKRLRPRDDAPLVGISIPAREVADLRDVLASIHRSLRQRKPEAMASRLVWRNVEERLDELQNATSRLAKPLDDAGSYYNVDVLNLRQRAVIVERRPLSIATALRAAFQGPTVFLSATISTGGDRGLKNYVRLVGKPVGHRPLTCVSYASPFDYDTHARLFVPRDVNPRETLDDARGHEYIRTLVAASHGRALVLFTSNTRMMSAFHAVKHYFETISNPYDSIDCHVVDPHGGPLDRGIKLAWLREKPGRVLFAARAFWEGVDVPGDELVLVIIDKIPYAVPEPVMEEARARRYAYELRRLPAHARYNDLRMYSTPHAIQNLQQAVGRLIRTETDRGVVAVLDNRLLNSSEILQALPLSPTTEIDLVCQFLRSMPPTGTDASK